MRVLKINSLPTVKDWIDRDTIMLHACFQILEDCIEKENVDTNSTHKDFINEVKELNKWWQIRKRIIHTIDTIEEDDKMLSRLIKIRTCLWT